jgi:hypothetical protein
MDGFVGTLVLWWLPLSTFVKGATSARLLFV